MMITMMMIFISEGIACREFIYLSCDIVIKQKVYFDWCLIPRKHTQIYMYDVTLQKHVYTSNMAAVTIADRMALQSVQWLG